MSILTQPRPLHSLRPALPDDLTIAKNGLVMARDAQGQAVDELDHLWFQVVEREAGQAYAGVKVVKLLMLRYLPQETKKDAGLVAKTKAALVGLYNTQVRFDVVQVVAGMFDPPIGIVQCYGVAAFEPTLEDALEQAELGMAALQGVLSNYIQSRFVPLDGQKAAWLLAALGKMPHALVAIGHPDARQNARGGGRETPEEQLDLAGQSAYTLQQNEMLFRGMSQVEEEFVFLLIAHRVNMHAITQMLAGISGEASVWASRVTGMKGLSFGVSVPIMLSGGLARTAGTNFAENSGRTAGQSIGDSRTNTHTVGVANTVGHADTHSVSHEVGTSHTEGNTVSLGTGTNTGTAHNTGKSESWGTSHTDGTNENWGTSQTNTHTSSAGVSTSHTQGATVTDSVGKSAGQAAGVTNTVGNTHGASVGNSDQHSSSWQAGASAQHGASDSDTSSWALSHGGSQATGVQASGSVLGIGGGGSQTATESISGTDTKGHSAGTNQGVGVSAGVGGSDGSGHSSSVSNSQSLSTAGSQSVNTGVNSGHSVARVNTTTTVATSSSSDSSSSGTSHSVGVSASDSKSHETGVSSGDTTSQGASQSRSESHSSADTNSESFGESWGETNSWSRTKSVSDAAAAGQTRGVSLAETFATGIGRSLNTGSSLGISGGVVPSLSASKSYNWVDAQAQQVAELLRIQEALLVQASTDGGYLTDVYMLTRTKKGRATAETLLRQAFHGSEKVVTGFRTRQLNGAEQAYIRQHALAFTPSTRIETIPGQLEAYKDTTFLPPDKLAALFAPGLFERGPAVTTEERIPPFTFIPDLAGDARLGRLWDVETATLTKAVLRLSEDKHMHTAFCGDTGFGKTVGAERLCVEVVNQWHHRAVVFDWGQGWRKLFTSPIPKERVVIYQLHARAVNPLRWNPLQIGRRIDPDTQWRATVELIANAGGLGPKQVSYLLSALRKVYVEHGVFTSDPDVQGHDTWGVIRNGSEAAATSASIGDPLSGLQPDQLQALAVQRSKDTDIADWVTAIDERLNGTFKRKPDGALVIGANGKPIREPDGMGKNDPNRASLEAAVARMDRLTQGVIGRRYAKGPGSIAIEDLGLYGTEGDQSHGEASLWGAAVLEGGAELDVFSKSVLLGLIAWHLYNDCVIRRRESIGRKLPALNLFFEEANKIFTGEAPRGDGNQPPSVAEQFLPMFTDGRKYRVYCHPILQSVSLLPEVILSSCVNLLVGQSKGAKDRDAILAHLAKSEKGFTDEEYKRFVSRMKVAMTICKLGYGHELWEIGPMLTEIDQIPASEPTDEDLRLWYRRAFLNAPTAAGLAQ